MTQQKYFDAFPNWDKSSNGCCEELKTKFVIERTIARAQHRIVRSSKSSACLGVQKAHTRFNLAEQIYWWFMLTHTHEGNAFLLLLSVWTFFLQICENLLLQICENFITLAIFVRTAISLLVRIAFLQIHGRNIPFTKSTIKCWWSQNCPQCRAEDGWGGDATLGPQTNELINWFLPINWFRTHTHRILSFLRYTLLGQRLLQTLNAI